MSKSTDVSINVGQDVAIFNPAAVRVKKKLVIPTIKLESMKVDDQLFFTMLGELSQKTKIDEKTGEVEKDKDGNDSILHLVEVRVLGGLWGNEVQMPKAGTEGQIVIGAILYRALKDEGELAGRSYALKKGESLGTGKARLWELVEIEV